MKQLFIILCSFFVLLQQVHSAENTKATILYSQHEAVLDDFLKRVNVRKTVLRSFEESFDRELDLTKKYWENNSEIESCMRDSLSPEMKYKYITLQAFKGLYSLEEATRAAKESQSEFTQTFFNLIKLAQLQGNDPAKNIKKHILENKEGYASFVENIMPAKLNNIGEKQSDIAYKYTLLTLNKCIYSKGAVN